MKDKILKDSLQIPEKNLDKLEEYQITEDDIDQKRCNIVLMLNLSRKLKLKKDFTHYHASVLFTQRKPAFNDGVVLKELFKNQISSIALVHVNEDTPIPEIYHFTQPG